MAFEQRPTEGMRVSCMGVEERLFLGIDWSSALVLLRTSREASVTKGARIRTTGRKPDYWLEARCQGLLVMGKTVDFTFCKAESHRIILSKGLMSFDLVSKESSF